jgi:hypothetical protein
MGSMAQSFVRGQVIMQMWVKVTNDANSQEVIHALFLPPHERD